MGKANITLSLVSKLSFDRSGSGCVTSFIAKILGPSVREYPFVGDSLHRINTRFKSIYLQKSTLMRADVQY